MSDSSEPGVEGAVQHIERAAKRGPEAAARVARKEVQRALHRDPREVHAEHEARLTRADRVARHLTNFMGSPSYFVWQTGFIILWVIINIVSLYGLHWDPYPYILLNLLFSTQAAYAAPLILLAQNKQAEIDRKVDLNAYQHIDDVRDTLKMQEERGIHQHEQIIALLEGIKAAMNGDANNA